MRDAYLDLERHHETARHTLRGSFALGLRTDRCALSARATRKNRRTKSRGRPAHSITRASSIARFGFPQHRRSRSLSMMAGNVARSRRNPLSSPYTLAYRVDRGRIVGGAPSSSITGYGDAGSLRLRADANTHRVPQPCDNHRSQRRGANCQRLLQYEPPKCARGFTSQCANQCANSRGARTVLSLRERMSRRPRRNNVLDGDRFRHRRSADNENQSRYDALHLASSRQSRAWAARRLRRRV